jgi:nitrogen fixation protein
MGPTQLKAFRRYQVPIHAGASTTIAAIQQPLGFEPSPQPTLLKQPRFLAAAMVATGLSLSPQPIVQPLVNGWSVSPPDFPAFRRFQVPVHAGATSPIAATVQPLFGWTNADMLLKRPTWAPEALGQIIGFGSFAPTFPWGWVAALPELPQPKLSNAAQVATGLTLPPQPIIRPLVNGWSIALPDLPQPKLSKAAQVATGLTLPPQPIIRPLVNGWSIALPDLPVFRRFFPMPEWTGRIDPPPIPPAFPYGWTVNVPELPQFKRTVSGATAGLSLPSQPIIRPLVNGWSIALPDLPAFRRFFPMPEWTGRIDFLPGSGSAVVFACAATQAVVAYSAATSSDAADYEAFGGNVADYGASGGDAAYSAVGRLNTVAYHQIVLLVQAQLYGSTAGKDVADYGAANTDAAYYKVTMLEFACTG